MRPKRPHRPPWLRQQPLTALHGIAGRLDNGYRTEGISHREKWLLDAVEAELRWRASHRPPADRCTCRFCCYDLFSVEDDRVELELPLS